MKRIVTRSIVLARVNYGEADRIVTILSPDSGKITLMAKGVRKLKSKLAGGIEPFTVNEITYIPGRSDVSTLVSGRMKVSYHKIVKDLQSSQIGYDYLKWLNEKLEDGTGAEYYDVLQGSLALLERYQDLSYCYFYLNYLKLHGQTVDPVTSTTDEKLEISSGYSFDFEKARFTEDESGAYQMEHIKLIRIILAGDPTVVAQLALPNEIVADVKELTQKLLIANPS